MSQLGQPRRCPVTTKDPPCPRSRPIFEKLRKERWFAPPAVVHGAHCQATQPVDATVRSAAFAAAGRHEERRIPTSRARGRPAGGGPPHWIDAKPHGNRSQGMTQYRTHLPQLDGRL